MLKYIFFLLVLVFSIFGCKENVNEPKVEGGKIKSVNFIGLQDSSTIYNPTRFSIKVESEDSIKKVIYFIDSDTVGISSTRPYMIEPNISPWADDSLHILKCSAYDINGNSKSQEIAVIISPIPRYRIQLTYPAPSDTMRWTNIVELKWSALFDYNFDVKVAKDIAFNDIVYSGKTNDMKAETNGLEKGTYYWQISITPDSSSQIYKSSIYMFTIDGPKPPVILSQKPEEIQTFNKENSFTWSSSKYATSYQFQISDYYSNNIITDNMLGDTTLTQNLDLYVYILKVRAKNTVNIWGAWSREIIFSNGLFAKKIALANDINLVTGINLSDSEYVAVGYSIVNKDTYLYTIDELGDLKETKRIPNFTISKIAKTLDNGVIMVGNNSSFESKVVKLDRNFNVVWSYLADNKQGIYLTNILQADDGNYFVTGFYKGVNSSLSKKICFLKLSNTGTPIFDKAIGVKGSEGYKIERVNGNYLIMAIIKDTVIYSNAIYNLVVNQNGDVLSETKYLEFNGFPAQNYNVNDGMLLNDNIYVVGSFGMAYGSFIHCSDIYGNEHWKKNLINGSSSSAQCCLATDNGNLLIGGYERSIFLFKTDNEGNIIWRKDYEGTYCKKIVKTKDSGFLILGFYNGKSNYIYLLKINKDGVTYDKL